MRVADVWSIDPAEGVVHWPVLYITRCPSLVLVGGPDLYKDFRLRVSHYVLGNTTST